MGILNILLVPENVKGDPLGFFKIHSDAKYQNKLKGDPLCKIFSFPVALTIC